MEDKKVEEEVKIKTVREEVKIETIPKKLAETLSFVQLRELCISWNIEIPEKPETPEVPKTDKPVVELPKTGLDLSAMSLVGAGALTYAGYAYIASRRG